MLLESSTWPQQEGSLALVCAHSISPQNFAPSLGQCSSERCWVRTPNYSLAVSLLYPYLFCAHGNSRIKNPYQQFFLASEKHCIQKIWLLQEAAFCFSLKVTVTKLFKEHFQPKTNKQTKRNNNNKTLSNPTLCDGKHRGIFAATQRRCYSFAALSLPSMAHQPEDAATWRRKHSAASVSKCKEHKVWETACNLYVTLMPGLKIQVVCVSN